MAPYPWTRLVGLSLAAALIGLGSHVAAEAMGWHFPSYGSFVDSTVWKLGMLAILVWGFRRWEGRDPDLAALGWRPGTTFREPRRIRLAILGLLGCAVLGAIIGQLFPAASSGDAYGTVHKAGWALALLELLVRYPMTVFAEESFFRGWLQPRIRVGAPVVSGLLFAGFHLQQARTIPSLIPLGIALGIIRWWTDDVRTTAVIHYLSNVAFFLTTYV